MEKARWSTASSSRFVDLAKISWQVPSLACHFQVGVAAALVLVHRA